MYLEEFFQLLLQKALKPLSVKMVATGEGEPIVTEILTRINSNNFDFSGIPRLWIKKIK